MNARVEPAQIIANERHARCGPDADLVEACQQAIWAIAVHCRALERDRRKKATYRAMVEQIDLVSEHTAATIYGAAWKSTVLTALRGTGLDHEAGGRLLASLLHEAHLLGIDGSNDGRTKLARRELQ